MILIFLFLRKSFLETRSHFQKLLFDIKLFLFYFSSSSLDYKNGDFPAIVFSKKCLLFWLLWHNIFSRIIFSFVLQLVIKNMQILFYTHLCWHCLSLSLMIHPSFVDLLKKRRRKNMFNWKRRDNQSVLQYQRNCNRFWVKIMHNVIFAMIPSMVWITLCLLRKNIYACSKVGATIYNNKTEAIQLEVDYHRVESMKLGFTLLQIFSAVLIISNAYEECHPKDNYWWWVLFCLTVIFSLKFWGYVLLTLFWKEKVSLN